MPYPFHSHGMQWEFYYVISDSGCMRDDSGSERIVAGDALLFQPGEAHQLINDCDVDLIVHVVADNPLGESAHFPDSNKYVLESPKRVMIRGDHLSYYDGEDG